MKREKLYKWSCVTVYFMYFIWLLTLNLFLLFTYLYWDNNPSNTLYLKKLNRHLVISWNHFHTVFILAVWAGQEVVMEQQFEELGPRLLAAEQLALPLQRADYLTQLLVSCEPPGLLLQLRVHGAFRGHQDRHVQSPPLGHLKHIYIPTALIVVYADIFSARFR